MAAVDRVSVPDWQFNAIQGSIEPDGARLTHISTGAELLVRGRRLMRGAGYGEAAPGPRRELARAGAILRLRQLHRYHVHAAGAVDRLGRAWLLVGPTGSGKSTLAYALARQGWTILGEDGVIIEVRDPVGPIAYGWQEPVRVSTTLSHTFPELNSGAGARLMPGDARRRAEVPVRGARSAPVAALVHIQQGPTDRLTVLAPTEALVELVRESAWVLIADGMARTHLDALRRIVTEVPTYQLIHSAAQLHCIERTLLGALL
jgi:hypothetical protein